MHFITFLTFLSLQFSTYFKTQEMNNPFLKMFYSLSPIKSYRFLDKNDLKYYFHLLATMSKHPRNTFVVHMICLLASSNYSSLFKVDAKRKLHMLSTYCFFIKYLLRIMIQLILTSELNGFPHHTNSKTSSERRRRYFICQYLINKVECKLDQMFIFLMTLALFCIIK